MKKFLSLFFLLNFTIFIWAQDISSFRFRTYQVNNGLSENSVTCIMQDHEGFLWLGTKDGLNKFDGVNFDVYRGETLGNNFIKSIVEGKNDTIFVGTDDGLYIMDRKNEKFTRLEKVLNVADKVITSITSLLLDKNNILWITTMYQGVYKFDPNKIELSRVKFRGFDLTKTIIWKVFEDKSGGIWIGTRRGLLQHNARTDSFDAVDGLTNYGDSSKNEILSIYEDQKGNLWLGTWADGILFYNKQHKGYTSYYGSNSIPYITHIRCFLQYSNNQLLIGADDGLYLFDTESKYCKRIDMPYNRYSLGDQNVYSMHRDQEGCIWIGTYFGGLNYLNNYNLKIEHYIPSDKEGFLSGKAVSQFCEDRNGNFWVATEDGGLNYFDIKTKKFSQPVKTSYHNIHPLLLINDDLWIGTFSRGLDIYNTQTKQIRNYRYQADNERSLNDDCIFSLYQSRQGEVYVGTTMGLNKYNPNKNDFTRIEKDSLSFVYDIKEDTYGNLWVASYNIGVAKYIPQKNKWVYYSNILAENDPIINTKLTGIYIDNQKRLWISSEGKGIFLYNYEKDSFTNISEEDGLLNNVVYGILDDQFGNIWVSTNKGLASFNPNIKGSWKFYDQEDGLQSNEFNYKSSYKSRDGKLYFGGINGFNSFSPQDLSENTNTAVPSVKITGLSLIGQKDSDLQKYIRECLNRKESIELSHSNSSFTISYISLSYVSPTKNQYAYKLEEVDQDWILVGNNRSVTYVNLPPGKYTFKIKASNNNGIWNDEGTELKFEILPPFWWSTPAKLLYTALVTALLYALILYYNRQTRRKQEQQLEAYKTEQETLAFKSKIEFFTNIAHEIRTPVSLIKAPLEEIMLSHDGNENTKQNLSIIEKNSDRLSVLINQLLDFRKMDSIHYSVNLSTFNLKKLLIEIYERFKKTAQHEKIEFVLDLPQENDILVTSDVDALIKITGNLLTNAMKFTKDQIKLKLDINQNKYTIMVSDNGRGILDKNKQQIFDPFYQVQSNSNKGGTGIGLFLVKHLSEVLNGDIFVQDNPSGGTVFSFTFENMPEQKSDEQQESDIRDEDWSNIPLSEQIEEKQSILVVEDNAELLSFIESSLKADYNVDTAEDAMIAMNLMNNKPYDLLITDIMMPQISGLDFVKQIRNDINYSHMPIILLSAKTNNMTKIEGLQLGADVFIEKPFSTSYLKAQISSLLYNRKAILDSFNKSPLASYSTLTTNKNDRQLIEKLNDEIDKHLADPNFTIESLADQLLISRSNLQRKLKNICGVTPGDYLRTYRLKKAAMLLIEDGLRINEVSFEVGFSSPSYFSKCFVKQFGMLPKEFIRKHQEQSQPNQNEYNS